MPSEQLDGLTSRPLSMTGPPARPDVSDRRKGPPSRATWEAVGALLGFTIGGLVGLYAGMAAFFATDCGLLHYTLLDDVVLCLALGGALAGTCAGFVFVCRPRE